MASFDGFKHSRSVNKRALVSTFPTIDAVRAHRAISSLTRTSKQGFIRNFPTSGSHLGRKFPVGKPKQGIYATFTSSGDPVALTALAQCQKDLAACQVENAYPISGQMFPSGFR